MARKEIGIEHRSERGQVAFLLADASEKVDRTLSQMAQTYSPTQEQVISTTMSLLYYQGLKQHYEQLIRAIDGRKDPEQDAYNARYWSFMNMTREGIYFPAKLTMISWGIGMAQYSHDLFPTDQEQSYHWSRVTKGIIRFALALPGEIEQGLDIQPFSH